MICLLANYRAVSFEYINNMTACVYAETHVGFAEKMYTAIEGESVEVCVRVIGSDEEIGNEKFYLEVVVQNDSQESIPAGATLASEFSVSLHYTNFAWSKPADILCL